MRISEEQYERVAQYLDGRDIDLDGAERDLSEEIRRDERLLAAFDVAPPASAMARARKRMIAALGRVRTRLLWLGRVVGVESAAVAALLLVAVTLATISTGPARRTRPAPVPTSVLLAPVVAPAGDDLDILAGQLDELEADMVASLTTSRLEIESLERDIQDFLMDDGQETWNDFSGG